MGICNSNQVSTPNSFTPIPHNPLASSPHLQPSLLIAPNMVAEDQSFNSKLCNKFMICSVLFEMLSGVSYSYNQAKDLMKALVHGVIDIESSTIKFNPQIFQLLFNKENIELIKNGKLYYYEMLDQLAKSTKISQIYKSKIYHTIANIKKEEIIQKEWINQYKVKCAKSNDYKKLSEIQIQEIVKYETIAEHTRQMGDKIGFKFQSIKKQSQKIVNLLKECMSKHIDHINSLKYDLSDDEVMKMAQFSRQACDYYDNGVFLLLVYFVQSTHKLQNQLTSTKLIEELLKKAIENISKIYPPGQGLSQQRKELIQRLKDLQNTKKYNKVQFKHSEITLKSPKKQAEVEEIITEYAKIAESNKDLFQELIKATCLSKCVYYKIGLKYYPSNPNKKALTRIKEKMFFKKEEKTDKQFDGDIKQILQKEQTAYKNIIDQILKGTQKVQFKISDMVRGKCVFLEVSDIIQSVNSIKKFVQKDPRFGIKQIESRFTKTIPISDVTLKIVINNQIVSELQLTIQTNAATYNFAHKIYQLQRSKVFSKLKITHNYFEQSKDDFSQLAKRCLQLQSIKTVIQPKTSKDISQYFKLSGVNLRPFQNILQEVLQINRQQLKKLVTTVDPLLQDLMNVAFSISIGRWGKSIGKIINQTIKKVNLSSKLKSVVLNIFFQAFQIPAESQQMQQLGMLQSQLKQKIFMEQYMKVYFQIQDAFKYIHQNQRLFQRAQQLKQISFSKIFQSLPITLQDTMFVENIVIEQNCLEKIQKLRELLNFYFVTRTDKEDKFYDKFSFYYNWIKKQLQTNKNTELLRSQISIIKAQQLLEKKQAKQAQMILQEALNIFKCQQEHSKVIQCQVLLAECFIKTANKELKQYIDQYDKNVIQKAQILGIQLKGPLYADAMWRISEYLWQGSQTSEDDKKLLLSTFTKNAIQQMSRSKGKQFIYALCKRWKLYDIKQIKHPQIKKNQKIKYAKLYGLGNQGCEYLTKVCWKKLNHLLLNNNNVGIIGCEYLSKTNFKNLTNLVLQNNQVGDIGCEHLSKAEWPNLTNLNLSTNSIGDAGCKYLSNANWKKLNVLILDTNDIAAKGCEYLSKADWKSLLNLHLQSNKFKTKGCEYLIMANWKNLTTLHLQNNIIGAEGCEHLSKGNWKNLNNLTLQNGNVGNVGCQHLSKADWKNLTSLDLYSNEIGEEGCRHLSKADWKNLRYLNLICNNSIQDRQSARMLFSQKDLQIKWHY